MLALILAQSHYVAIAGADRCSDQGVDYNAANMNCKLSSSCLLVECINASNLEDKSTAVLSVTNCTDPIQVLLSIFGTSQQCSQTLSVGTDGQGKEVSLDGHLVKVSHWRNASNLQISVSW